MRWNMPICGHTPYMLECGRGDGAGVLCGHRGDVLAGVPFDILGGSLFRCVASHRCQLHATGAVPATTPWVFGSGAGVPAPPTPWLLVLMLASFGHARPCDRRFGDDIFCSGRAAERIVVLGADGVFTRSDVVRVLGGLLWASTGVMFGWYAQANMPMLTVMVFLPAAFALVFRAVGMYHTEDPLKPRTSVQAAAIAALCFIPVVAAEPQLLFALIVVFLMFLLFVRRKRAMLLLIPVPAAFAVAPTLVNAVRYADLGMWRQLFGDITVPTSSANGSPASLSLLEAAQRALGWRMGRLVMPIWRSLCCLASSRCLLLLRWCCRSRCGPRD